MKNLVCSITLLASFLSSTAAFAQGVLYDLDFTMPEVGSYSVLYGTPAVVPSFGGMTDAMLFRARATNWDAITLSMEAQPSAYTIDFDVVTHGLRNSLYTFMIYLSTAETRNVFFHGGLNAIGVFQPFPYTDQGVQAFADDVPYHLTILADFPNNAWQLRVDGVPVYQNVFNAADIQQVAFALNGWHAAAVDNPNVQVALDNIRVEAIPEPSPCLLFSTAILVMYGWRARLFMRVEKEAAARRGCRKLR